MRMPRYNVSNDGMGPYAIFYCDKCNREYRSQPNVANTVKQDVAKSAFGGLLRNVPLVGSAIADNMEQDRYRTDMSQQELNGAWGQVQQYFRECPTCQQVVCISDFDMQSGYCNDDTPRKQEIAEAQAAQAAGFVKGVASIFGVTDAFRQAGEQMAEAQEKAKASLATCPKCGNQALAGKKFCDECGSQMTQPVAQSVTCSNCGAQVAAGKKFCADCGTPVQQQ
ncbi:MAG: zinc ribbon domain-containing protein [Chloroflexota bacterium]|nr:zinc ribbon domain-containing protein [Chloroflexota bacterium]MDQ5866520.1 zinc ribbon domain-containing protein [Chloroflexota bacterium]